MLKWRLNDKGLLRTHHTIESSQAVSLSASVPSREEGPDENVVEGRAVDEQTPCRFQHPIGYFFIYLIKESLIPFGKTKPTNCKPINYLFSKPHKDKELSFFQFLVDMHIGGATYQ